MDRKRQKLAEMSIKTEVPKLDFC